jgi:hypothetical protein
VLAEDALLLVLQLPLIIEVGSIKEYIHFSRRHIIVYGRMDMCIYDIGQRY